MLGSNGSVCPPTFFPLDYDAACMSAASLANTTYGGSLSLEGYPAGCFWHTIDGSVYFNAKGASGTVNSFALQLCAGVPIPALRYAVDAAEHGSRQGPKSYCLDVRVRSVPCLPCLRVCVHT